MFVFLFFLIALFSEIVGTVAGFGSSVFFVPLAGLFFDFHTVLALTSILHVFSNAAKLVLFGRHMQWRLLLLPAIPSVCLRDSWSAVKLTSGWMMPPASRAIILLGKLSLQPGLEFRADKFVTTTYKDLRLILVRCGDVL
jgi:hypothetical protein